MKKIILNFLGYILTIFGVITLFMGLMYFTTSSIANDNSINRAKEIEELFFKSSKFIDSQKDIPSQNDFYKWANKNLSSNKNHIGLEYYTYYENNEIPEKAYLLQLWRGEWYEKYSSWKDKKSTLMLDKSKYYFTGSLLLDTLVILSLAFIFLYTSRRLKKQVYKNS